MPTPDYTDFSPSKSLCIYANSNYIIIAFSLVQCFFSHSTTYYAWTILNTFEWQKRSESRLLQCWSNNSFLKHESITSFHKWFHRFENNYVYISLTFPFSKLNIFTYFNCSFNVLVPRFLITLVALFQINSFVGIPLVIPRTENRAPGRIVS